MTYLNGGYSIIKKDDENIYASVEKALTNGKPILFYEDANTCYYIDLILKSGDDIVLTKGGKTITITDSNVVTESGEIQNHLYQHRIEMTYSGENAEKICFIVYNDKKDALNINDIDDYVVGNFYAYDNSVNVPFNYIYVDNGEIYIENLNGDRINNEDWIIGNLGEELSYTDYITQIF